MPEKDFTPKPGAIDIFTTAIAAIIISSWPSALYNYAVNGNLSGLGAGMMIILFAILLTPFPYILIDRKFNIFKNNDNYFLIRFLVPFLYLFIAAPLGIFLEDKLPTGNFTLDLKIKSVIIAGHPEPIYIEPKNISLNEISFRSNNPSIATVNGNGIVYGVSTGQTSITVEYRGKTKDLPVNVKYIPIDEIRIKTEVVPLNSEKELILEVTPELNSDSIESINSSDEEILKITYTSIGYSIYGNNTGVANIIIKTKSGKEFTYPIKVT